jgi:hypothetical protein
MNVRYDRLSVLLGLSLAGCYSGYSADEATPFSSGDPEQPGEGDGGGEDPDNPDGPGPSAQCEGSNPRLPPTVRGLNSQQFANTVGAVFPGVQAPVDLFYDSDRSADYSTRSTIRRLDFKTTADLVQVAESVSVEAANVVRSQYPCLQEVPASDTCVDDVLADVARKLYRAPAPSEHLGKLRELYAQASSATDGAQGLQWVLRAMLTSPRFLFRSELGVPQADGSRRLSAHEVAAALSYTLTDAPPDDALQAAADAGELLDPAQLQAHADRLLASDTGTNGMLSYIGEFTGLINFDLIHKDPAVYPGFDDAVKDAMLADFKATVAAILRSSAPTLEHLLTSDAFVVSDLTAQYLGWAQTSSAGELVPLEESQRRGMLTHPAMMVAYSHHEETNPVARGHFVSGQLLCFQILPPAENVTFPDRDAVGQNETLRETLERIHAVGACASCHALMDPYGWPFEVFDATGRLRSLDRGLPIDTTSDITIPDGYVGPIDNVNDLLDVTAESETAHVCVSRSLFSYVSGHGADAYEEFDCLTEELAHAFAEDGDVPSQIVRVLSSPAFLERAP